MSEKITDRDTGWGALWKAIREITSNGSYAKVGLIGDGAAKAEHESEGKPLTNVELMAIHEFGTGTVPERSVIRKVFDAERENYVALLRRLVPGIYEGRASPKKVLDIVGMRAKFDMKNFILDGKVTPPLSEATIKAKERKGRWNKGSTASRSPIPLVDTGRLAASIDHSVVINGQEQRSSSEETVGSATIVKGE